MSDAKNRILARRARFMMAAVASLGVAACGKVSEDEPGVTTDAAASDSGTNTGDTFEPCLVAPPEDTMPNACLSAPFDSGMADTGAADTRDTGSVEDAFDTGPEPCLFAPIDSGPAPCLKMAPDSGSD